MNSLSYDLWKLTKIVSTNYAKSNYVGVLIIASSRMAHALRAVLYRSVRKVFPRLRDSFLCPESTTM